MQNCQINATKPCIKVNNTMLDYLISIIAPHKCRGCGTTYDVLCPACIDVILDTESTCFCCAKPTFQSWLCDLCQQKCTYDNAWAVGLYETALKSAINDYKFRRARAAYRVFAKMINCRLPVLPIGTVVTNVPTASKRVRQRGYDQTELIAKRFAKLRNVPYDQLLVRVSQSQQVGSNKKTRKQQAVSSYKSRKKVAEVVLIIDDVCTTGATLSAAAEVLKSSGAKIVLAATLAYEPLRGKIG